MAVEPKKLVIPADEVVRVTGKKHYADTLDGVALRDGEILHVKWPDGKSEDVLILVVTRKCGRKVLGTESYYVAKYHGRNAWVGLLSMVATRVV